MPLFSQREPIPNEPAFKQVYPKLESYDFPEALLTEDLLGNSLHPARLAAIRAALQGEECSEIKISYIAPWSEASQMPRGVIDMAFSQAVLEHVDNVPLTYASLYQWLRPGGFMSHTVDFKSHETTRDWYGHWVVSDFMWDMIRGKLTYLINRWPYSAHISELDTAGFRIVGAMRVEGSPICRKMLSRKFESLTDEDLRTSMAFIQAVKAVC